MCHWGVMGRIGASASLQFDNMPSSRIGGVIVAVVGGDFRATGATDAAGGSSDDDNDVGDAGDTSGDGVLNVSAESLRDTRNLHLHSPGVFLTPSRHRGTQKWLYAPPLLSEAHFSAVSSLTGWTLLDTAPGSSLGQPSSHHAAAASSAAPAASAPSVSSADTSVPLGAGAGAAADGVGSAGQKRFVFDAVPARDGLPMVAPAGLPARGTSSQAIMWLPASAALSLRCVTVQLMAVGRHVMLCGCHGDTAEVIGDGVLADVAALNCESRGRCSCALRSGSVELLSLKTVCLCVCVSVCLCLQLRVNQSTLLADRLACSPLKRLLALVYTAVCTLGVVAPSRGCSCRQVRPRGL